MLHEIQQKRNWELWKVKSLNVLNFETCLEQYLGNGNFQNTELIAGLLDQ